MDKWLLNNTSTKIIALLLGVMLFIVVHKDDASTTATQPLIVTQWFNNVQVETIGLDEESYVMRSSTPEKVRIQLRGKKSVLSSATPEDYRIILDLTGYGEGEHVVPLKHELSSGIELVSMQPTTVTVVLEQVETQQYEVQVKTEGTPEEGYTAGTPIIRPSNRVHVTLPSTRMAEVESVTAVVNIDKASESVIQKQVKLTAYNAAGEEMKDVVITPSVVEVEIPITKPFKSVPVHVNVTGQLPSGLSVAEIEPSVNTVMLYGSNSVLDGIEFYDRIQVDVSSMQQAGTYTVNVKLTPPENIEKMEPSAIDVTVTVAPDIERVIAGVPISLTGVNDRLQTTISEPASRTYDVTVIGAQRVVEGLTAEDIQLIANVNDLPPGTHEVTLQVNLPRFVTLLNNTSYKTVIVIEDTEAPVTTTPDPSSPESEPDTETNPEQTEEQPTDSPEEDSGTQQDGESSTSPEG